MAEELTKIADKVFSAVDDARTKTNARLNKNIMRLNLLGPYIITDVNGHNCFLVESPFGKKETVHAARIKFYDGQQFEVSELVKKQFTYNCGRFEVDELLQIKFLNGDHQILVKWKGFTKEDATYENAAQLYSDVPETVKSFLLAKSRTDESASYLRRILAVYEIQIQKAES